MATAPDTSPNVPDIAPDYVDSPPPDTGHRTGECIPNVPDVQPEVVPAPPPPPPRPERPEDVDPVGASGLTVPVWLRWGYFGVCLLLVGGFGLFLTSQVISSLALARTLPVWAQYLLLIPLGFCGLALATVCVSLVWSWFRLRSFRQVNLPALEELRQRAESRKDGAEHYKKARENLEAYLTGYPVTGRGAGGLAAIGMTDAELGKLFDERRHLLETSTDSKNWLDDFRRLFQSRLDAFAAARVNSWALKAAGCVMASPLPLLDAMLILGISLRMIRELCLVYNIRTSRTASAILLVRAIRNAFIAGVAADASEAAGEAVGDQLSEILGDSAFGTVSASFARVLAPKLGEGALNGLFMRRLGKATIRMLQPLRS